MEGKRQATFLPVIDMLNHKEPQETVWEYDPNRKGAVITALTNIPRGGQVFDTYGNFRGAHSFFYCYGFAAEGCGMKTQVSLNPDNFNFDPSDPLFELKKS